MNEEEKGIAFNKGFEAGQKHSLPAPETKEFMDETRRNTQSDHDLLVELRTEFRSFREDIKDLKENITGKIQDHENRIRKLEEKIWWAIGAGAVMATLASWVLSRV